jgi:hypothetical protein
VRRELRKQQETPRASNVQPIRKDAVLRAKGAHWCIREGLGALIAEWRTSPRFDGRDPLMLAVAIHGYQWLAFLR